MKNSCYLKYGYVQPEKHFYLHLSCLQWSSNYGYKGKLQSFQISATPMITIVTFIP